eukprot:m.34569 g.34569  ORF g.34569 m.34569 type:complete len:195 (-) comp5155_c0_seq1:15-599(-)
MHRAHGSAATQRLNPGGEALEKRNSLTGLFSKFRKGDYSRVRISSDSSADTPNYASDLTPKSTTPSTPQRRPSEVVELPMKVVTIFRPDPKQSLSMEIESYTTMLGEMKRAEWRDGEKLGIHIIRVFPEGLAHMSGVEADETITAVNNAVWNRSAPKKSFQKMHAELKKATQNVTLLVLPKQASDRHRHGGWDK